MKRTAIILAILATVGGCQGAPEYAGTKSKADNEVTLGWGRGIRLGAETDGVLEGLETSNGTKIARLSLTQSPATTMREGWVPAMGAYVAQQEGFRRILEQHGINAVNIGNMIFSGLNQLAQTAMPTLGMAVQGHYSVREIEARQPSIQRELINGIAGGLLSLPQAQSLMEFLPKSIEANVMSDPRVLATFEAMRKELEAVKPPPAEPPHEGVSPATHRDDAPKDVQLRSARANEPMGL